jgi:hypothetical protein
MRIALTVLVGYDPSQLAAAADNPGNGLVVLPEPFVSVSIGHRISRLKTI